MRNFVRIVFLLLLADLSMIGTGNCQLLVTTPDFPVDTSTITITADFTKGNQGLINYANTGDVYVHVGVITNLSANSTDWKHVIFTWGSTNASARAASIGTNQYQFTINNIRSFFGVGAGETILKIAILFRNGTGSLVQRNADGSDMFLPVYDNSLASKFILPPFQPNYIPVPETINKNLGDNIDLKYLSNQAGTISLYLNGSAIASAASNSITASSVITVAGNQQIVGRIDNGTTSRSDTINFYVPSPVVTAPLPAGTRDGINYLPGDTSVILVLFAPQKNKVVVIGDFNNWTQDTSYQMRKTPDGKYFWLQVNGLVAGTEYAYQYIIDDALKVADYYTEKVLDPANDQAIPSSVYPNLKPYPVGKTTGNVSVLQTAAATYNWSVPNFTRPDKRNLAVYELLVRDFVATHDYKTIRDSLSYLQRLGINAIELMPVNEFEGNSSWGYNPSFYFAPDKYYGTKNSLKELIDSCHARGIAVIMDMVLNHSFGQSPMVQMYFDAANNRPAANNPWFNAITPHAFGFGFDFNHESDATKYFVDRVLQFWLTEYKMDGFRFDFTKGFTQKTSTDDASFSAYDASRIAILKRINNTVRTAVPDAYVILEHFAVNDEEKELAADGMMLWGNLNYNFNQATMGWLDNNSSDLSQALYTARGYANPYLLAYMESHDEERLAYKNLKYGNQANGYIIKGDTSKSLLRNTMGAAFYFGMPGPKMIWEFGELGYDYSRCYLSTNGENGDCNTKTDPKPTGWNYLQNANKKRLHDVYAALLKLRNDYPSVFISGTPTYNLSGAFKILQVTHADLDITVIGNFDVVPATGSVNFQAGGTWYNYLTGETLAVTNTNQTFTLAPGEFRFLVNKNISNVVLPPTGDTTSLANKFSIKIYPNPVRDNRSVVEYELTQSGQTNISIYNITGNKLGTMNLGNQSKGKHRLESDQLPLNPAILPNGIYVMQILSSGNSSQVPFAIIK